MMAGSLRRTGFFGVGGKAMRKRCRIRLLVAPCWGLPLDQRNTILYVLSIVWQFLARAAYYSSTGRGAANMLSLSWFDEQYDAPFIMFAADHWIALGLVVLFCVLLYAAREPIRRSAKLRAASRLLLIAVLAASEALLQLWYITQGVWRSSLSLPLELCGITLLLSIMMLVTRSKRLYEFLFFAGIGGATIALLTPSLDYPYPHFRFVLFFVAHGAIIAAPLYMTWIERYRPTWKSVFLTMLYLNVVAVCVYTANRILDANYMFLVRKPSTFSFLDYFGPYPVYLIVEELFAFILFALIYTLFFAWRKEISK
jgi:hypothetical integral membrane protein (TIGR02206 family)